MKRLLALICALVLITGYAMSESQVSPEEPTNTLEEVVETIEEPVVELVEEAPSEEVPETPSDPLPEEPVAETVEEPVVEELVVKEPVVEEPIAEEPIEEEQTETPIVEEQTETPVVEKPVEEEPIENLVVEEPVEEVEEETAIEETTEEIIAEVVESEEPSSDVTSGAIEFEEDDWGEITIEFKREVYISFLREPKSIGDTVTLVATLVNFKPEDQYTIAWQYSIDREEWISIEGEDERTYTFILDENNCQYSYRALVNVED